MNLRSNEIWGFNCPTLEDLERAHKAESEVVVHAMWRSRRSNGQSMQDMLNRCVPLRLRVLSMRELACGERRVSVTALVTEDVPRGSLRSDYESISDPGLSELVAGTHLIFDYYAEDQTMKVIEIIFPSASNGSDEQNADKVPQGEGIQSVPAAEAE